METPVSASLKIGKTSDIPQSNSKSQYLGLPSYQYLEINNTKDMTQSNFQFNTRKPLFQQTLIQFQIPILRLAMKSISRNEITHRIRPNPISNPIHGNPVLTSLKIGKASDKP